MTQNPFDALGGPGGFDINALMQQAMAMQEQLQDAQDRLADTTVTGTAAGLVTATVNGVGELLAVELAPGAEYDEIGDLVVAAYRDAKAKADQLASDTLGPLAGGAPGDEPPNMPGKLGF